MERFSERAVRSTPPARSRGSQRCACELRQCEPVPGMRSTPAGANVYRVRRRHTECGCQPTGAQPGRVARGLKYTPHVTPRSRQVLMTGEFPNCLAGCPSQWCWRSR